MGLYTKVILQMEKLMGTDEYLQTAMCMKECGKMTRQTEWELTSTKTDQLIQENGLQMNNMGKARKFGQTNLLTKEVSKMGKRKEEEPLNGQMAASTWGISKIMFRMEKELTRGQTAENTQGIGRTRRWTAKGHTHGQTDDST